MINTRYDPWNMLTELPPCFSFYVTHRIITYSLNTSAALLREPCYKVVQYWKVQKTRRHYEDSSDVLCRKKAPSFPDLVNLFKQSTVSGQIPITIKIIIAKNYVGTIHRLWLSSNISELYFSGSFPYFREVIAVITITSLKCVRSLCLSPVWCRGKKVP